MKVLLRISNNGNKKARLSCVDDKKMAFLHTLSIVNDPHELYVFADNVTDELYNFINDNYNSSRVYRTHYGNAKSLIHLLDFAIENFEDSDSIYFLEDDYIHLPQALDIIDEGLNISHYSSGYDHPDKYINYSEGGPNPYISGGGESTRLLVTKSRHWKYTNSCCMTFATKLKTLKEDYTIIINNPADFQMFCTLRTQKQRNIVSCIPSVSTHGEIDWLAKFVDWECVFENSINELSHNKCEK
jgi:hypothetical protein